MASTIMFPKVSPEAMNAQVYRYGVPILWREATRCNCWDADSGAPLQTCAACHGEGFIYAAGVQDFATVQNITFSKEFTPFGEWRSGDCTLTVSNQKPVDAAGQVLTNTNLEYAPNGLPQNVANWVTNPVYDIGDWDLVILTQSLFKSSETLIMGQRMYGRQADTLRNPEGVVVKYVQQANINTGAITTFNPGTDYNVVKTPLGYQVQWVAGGSNPGAGNQYSVTYNHNPVYQVFTQLPQANDQADGHLPKTVMVRYRDVMGANGQVV